MSDLSGSLSSFHLMPLARFIAEQGKSGNLVISYGGWLGEVSFDLQAYRKRGRVGSAANRLLQELRVSPPPRAG
ncbi:MAG TPA: hypothetical protein VFA49_14055 [Chloroflexota bacterium]|nr:hypothetical protein [Chloroflexota bacterium]